MKVIYFDIDTLRPDHLSCCGYGRLLLFKKNEKSFQKE